MNPSEQLFYAAKEALSVTVRGRKEPISKDFMRKKGRDLYEQYVHLQLQVIMPLSRFTNLSMQPLYPISLTNENKLEAALLQSALKLNSVIVYKKLDIVILPGIILLVAAILQLRNRAGL